MQTLANILPVPDAESVRHRNATLPSPASRHTNESFAALMSRAMSPASREKTASPPPDSQANNRTQNTERRDPISTHKTPRQSGAPNKTRKDTASLEPATDNPLTQEESTPNQGGTPATKAGKDDSDKSSDSLPSNELNAVVADTQYVPNQMLALPLAMSLPAVAAPPLVGNMMATNVTSSEVGALQAKNSVLAVETLSGAQSPSNQAASAMIPGLKAGQQNKSAAATKAPASEKNDPAGTKVVGTSPAGIEALSLKSVDPTPDDLTSQNNSDGSSDKSSAGETSTAPDSKKESAAATAFQTHGTPAAKQEMPMKKQDNTNNVAGLGEQVLPGQITASAPEKSLSGHGIFTVQPSAGAAASDTAAAVNSATTSQPMTVASASNDTLVSSNLIDLPARALERTHDMVALHALRLVDIKSDSLQVVIKPGAGIQLSLELRQSGDGIEARAILQQGDLNQMNQHWAELQQRLEQRGIRLAPLTGDENSAAFGGNNQFQKQQRPPEEQDPLAAGAFAEFALAGAMIAPSGQTAIHAGAQHGWQTWA